MVTAKTLQQLFNQALNVAEFPSNLKNADVTPVFEKNSAKYGKLQTGQYSIYYFKSI